MAAHRPHLSAHAVDAHLVLAPVVQTAACLCAGQRVSRMHEPQCEPADESRAGQYRPHSRRPSGNHAQSGGVDPELNIRMKLFSRTALAIVACGAAAYCANWLTYSGSPERDGWSRDESELSRDNVGKLKLLWSTKLENAPRE